MNKLKAYTEIIDHIKTSLDNIEVNLKPLGVWQTYKRMNTYVNQEGKSQSVSIEKAAELAEAVNLTLEIVINSK